ncbi:MAG: arsenite methyltransferase [Myxococcota bacterium]
MKNERVVRKVYGDIGAGRRQGCCATSSCASSPGESISERLGYDARQLGDVPERANLGLGCGNPTAMASLREGEVVVDLGSGGGLDAFIAAKQVGSSGRVIGVDMTPEMIDRARDNALGSEWAHVEFRLGEIEHLPIADSSADVIISNCVINLSSDKPRVFAEAFRVLRPGGRLAISDVLAERALPNEVLEDIASLVGCVSGAATIPELITMLDGAGFQQIAVSPSLESKRIIAEWFPRAGYEDYVVSASIEARKPLDGSGEVA